MRVLAIPPERVGIPEMSLEFEGEHFPQAGQWIYLPVNGVTSTFVVAEVRWSMLHGRFLPRLLLEDPEDAE